MEEITKDQNKQDTEENNNSSTSAIASTTETDTKENVPSQAPAPALVAPPVPEAPAEVPAPVPAAVVALAAPEVPAPASEAPAAVAAPASEAPAAVAAPASEAPAAVAAPASEAPAAVAAPAGGGKKYRDFKDTEIRKERDLATAVTNLSLNPKKSFESFVIRANGNVYECIGRTGKGSFGVVYKSVIQSTRQTVAIKKVLQDPNYKNRELQIMRMVKHPNTVELIDSFYQRDKAHGEVFLNLILGYMPENLYEVSSKYAKRNEQMPILHIQAYIWQLCRALGYVHNLGICHRDIKPQNLLINSETQRLRLCDFGSAKILVRGEQNVSYICSRYYRAPELIFGASFYTTAIDMWSTGCVMAELILGTPLFAGDSGIDQLVEIIKVLGTPTRKQIHAMNPEYKDYNKFPSIKRHPWDKLFPHDTPPAALDIMAKMLRYTPSHRILPLEALCHPFFDDLKKAQGGGPTISSFFDFSSEELHTSYELGILHDLFPSVELQKLSHHYDLSKPPKPKRVYHSTSDSSSSDEDDDDNDDPGDPASSSSDQDDQ